ncbi:hypothetical protein SLOPH_471 [Spraguea lophii 42_110]|uniref:Uncharacterized protein n=1 Tax=Spraguea lophii (strain 42_110) TaxID=1358809 RepID=S7W9A0_SPRLO|nr:hypothetical protein SLOPH_471 [Spraguea lophii 42_110]
MYSLFGIYMRIYIAHILYFMKLLFNILFVFLITIELECRNLLYTFKFKNVYRIKFTDGMYKRKCNILFLENNIEVCKNYTREHFILSNGCFLVDKNISLNEDYSGQLTLKQFYYELECVNKKYKEHMEKIIMGMCLEDILKMELFVGMENTRYESAFEKSKDVESDKLRNLKYYKLPVNDLDGECKEDASLASALKKDIPVSSSDSYKKDLPLSGGISYSGKNIPKKCLAAIFEENTECDGLVKVYPTTTSPKLLSMMTYFDNSAKPGFVTTKKKVDFKDVSNSGYTSGKNKKEDGWQYVVSRKKSIDEMKSSTKTLNPWGRLKSSENPFKTIKPLKIPSPSENSPLESANPFKTTDPLENLKLSENSKSSKKLNSSENPLESRSSFKINNFTQTFNQPENNNILLCKDIENKSKPSESTEKFNCRGCTPLGFNIKKQELTIVIDLASSNKSCSESSIPDKCKEINNSEKYNSTGSLRNQCLLARKKFLD